MKRSLKVFYWISGDPPSDTYQLTVIWEDGDGPTTFDLQQLLAEKNPRLSGAYVRLWKVS